jgi:hypothetical protein
VNRHNELNTSSINPKHGFMTRAVLNSYVNKITNEKNKRKNYVKNHRKEPSIDLSSSEYRMIKEFTKVMKVTPRQISKSGSMSKNNNHIHTVHPHIQVKQSNKTSEVKIFIEDKWNQRKCMVNQSSALQSLEDKDVMNYIDKALKVTLNKGN